MADDTTDITARLGEVERIAAWAREQMTIHKTNTENAMQAHKGAMEAFSNLQTAYNAATAKISKYENRIAALEKAKPAA